MTEIVTFKLREPIPAHGEDLSELKFRAPTSQDIIDIGSPIRLDMASEPPGVEHNEKRMAQMMARLAAVPPSSITKLHHSDFLELEWLLTPFFIPKPGTI
ncbi:hypothetical protein GGC47_001057 [Bosea sp. OAE752]|uniref:phage tail assembly protein n=1 Tax=Bosea sp. OAE752 TaxID=2663873 RepID=UPI003D1CAA6B